MISLSVVPIQQLAKVHIIHALNKSPPVEFSVQARITSEQLTCCFKTELNESSY